MVVKRDFTDRFLKSIKPVDAGKRAIIWDAQVHGFGIRVTDRATWKRAAFVLADVLLWEAPTPASRRIGDYPAMSLAKAREIAREWREDIRQGIDPKAKRSRPAAPGRAPAGRYVRSGFLTPSPTIIPFDAAHRQGGEGRHREKHVMFRKWGSRPDFRDRAGGRKTNWSGRSKRDIPIGANRVLAYLKTFFWLEPVDQELIDASPAAAVKRPSKEVKRDRVLTDLEIRAIWLACGELGAFGRAFKMMLATSVGSAGPKSAKMTRSEHRSAARRPMDPRQRERTKLADRRPWSSTIRFGDGYHRRKPKARRLRLFLGPKRAKPHEGRGHGKARRHKRMVESEDGSGQTGVEKSAGAGRRARRRSAGSYSRVAIARSQADRGNAYGEARRRSRRHRQGS